MLISSSVDTRVTFGAPHCFISLAMRAKRLRLVLSIVSDSENKKNKCTFSVYGKVPNDRGVVNPVRHRSEIGGFLAF